MKSKLGFPMEEEGARDLLHPVFFSTPTGNIPKKRKI